MAIPVVMPKAGNTVEECVLVAWKKKKGEAVKTGEVLAEIETDKATFEVEAPGDGILLDTFFNEGELVPVLVNICALGAAGEAVASLRPSKTAGPAKTAAAPQAAVAAGPAAAAPTTVSTAVKMPAPAEVFLSPRARRFAAEHGFCAKNIAGSGPGGRVLEKDVREAYFGSKRFSSLAALLVREEGRRSPESGSGPGGMIVAADLGPAPQELSGIRTKIATRMKASLDNAAQLTMHGSAMATGLLALRKKIKKALTTTKMADINLNDMVMFACVRALVDHPELNAEFIGGKLYRHQDVHLAFACDTKKGLVVPVIRRAQALSISQLAVRTKQLAAEAIEFRISPDDLSGGSFTISNLGMFGIEAFTPIINAPQVAILGVNNIQLKPVRQGDQVVYVDHIGLSLTIDHQVVDGAPGAVFLKTLKKYIEDIESICGLNL